MDSVTTESKPQEQPETDCDENAFNVIVLGTGVVESIVAGYETAIPLPADKTIETT